MQYNYEKFQLDEDDVVPVIINYLIINFTTYLSTMDVYKQHCPLNGKRLEKTHKCIK